MTTEERIDLLLALVNTEPDKWDDVRWALSELRRAREALAQIRDNNGGIAGEIARRGLGEETP